MAEFSSQVMQDADVTVVKATGMLSADAILDYAKQLHDSPEMTLHFLWDIREALLDEMTVEDFRGMESRMRKVVRNRPGGKTALVFDTDLSYGLGRLYTSYAELNSPQVRYSVFRKIDDAMKWLQS